jgi:heme-degrading monooxygenase HmoA
MFAVLFEVHPKTERWDDYLGLAKMLKPELEQIDGFIENIRYRSLTREGWLLSLSVWHDEKAVVRWRTQAKHHGVQEKGRFEIFSDYHLRVGQVTKDRGLPPGETLPEQRLDETEVGEGTVVTLTDGKRPADWVMGAKVEDVAAWLGLERESAGRVAWDVFDAVLTPGDIILLTTWRDRTAAEAFARRAAPERRLRSIRVIRDYGMFDRREAPQYYAEVARR